MIINKIIELKNTLNNILNKIFPHKIICKLVFKYICNINALNYIYVLENICMYNHYKWYDKTFAFVIKRLYTILKLNHIKA